VENREGEFYTGRSYRDAPEVDGEVLIPFEGVEMKEGEMYKVKVYDCNEYDIYARQEAE
jgi:ribosomal protein S12 methylthiotransferase